MLSSNCHNRVTVVRDAAQSPEANAYGQLPRNVLQPHIPLRTDLGRSAFRRLERGFPPPAARARPCAGAIMASAHGVMDINDNPRGYPSGSCLDGTGYADGLAGDAIPLGGRVLAGVDAFRAITEPRVVAAFGATIEE